MADREDLEALEELTDVQVSRVYLGTQEELRAVAEDFWAAAARLHRSTGYAGLSEIIAAPQDVPVREQIITLKIRLTRL